VYYGQLGGLYDFQVTNLIAPEGGRGALAQSSPGLLLVTWESYVTPGCTVTPVYIAVRIRVQH
jgi:hypothetical protein